jgi:FecR protein
MSGPDFPPSRKQPPDVDGLLRAFVEQPVLPLAGEEARQLRERITRHLTPAASVREARWRPWLLFAAAACLPVAIWASAALLHAHDAPRRPDAAIVTSLSGPAEIARGDVARSIESLGDAPVGQGDELRTGQDASARASLPTGAVVDVGPWARVRFVTLAGGSVLRDRLELVAGRVQVRVPKLRAGDELRVQTADATVVVHGTKFSVERVAPSGDRPGGTRVIVTEGVVTVDSAQGERTLTAGTELVTLPDAPAPQAASATPTPAAAPATEPSAPAANSPSTLGAENALLSQAMRLHRGGQTDRALGLLDAFVGRYPGSPLMETARVERLRILEETGATDRLGREAERYLGDYPRGFARQEVSRMLATARAPSP